MRIDRLQSEYDIDIHWTAFPLNPSVPPEGYPLADYYASRNLDMEERVGHMRQVAGRLGLPFGKRERIYNSRLAQELGKWAEKMGHGEDYHRALFKAYFVDGVNIAEVKNLEKIGAQVGLEKSEIKEVVASRSFKTAVDEDWQRSRQLGINAVPTFMLKETTLVGAQSQESLSKFLAYHQIPRRKSA